MVDLFGVDGMAALDRLARQRTLYAFDFDGTLAPIVAHPDDARARPGTTALMSTLSREAPTLVLTGRSVEDLRRRMDFTPRYAIGNHGAEGLPDGLADETTLATHREIVRTWVAAWPAALAAQTDDAGIFIEAKHYSLSIHYRPSEDHSAAARAIDAAIATLVPAPRVIGGKCVVNLLPEGAADKGHALGALVRFDGATTAFFIGDDVTDEHGFVGAPESWVTVRVGRSADSAARFFIDDQAAIDRCLALLVERIAASSSPR